MVSLSDFKNCISYQNFVVLILVIIALVWLVLSIWYNWKVTNIRHWPKTNAMVVKAFVEPKNGGSRTLIDPRFLVSIDPSTKYVPRVLYRYFVDGKEYQSDNVVYGGGEYGFHNIKVLMGNIFVGSTIQIRYNPRNPSESYIYCGGHNYCGIIMSIVLLLIAFLVCYYFNVVRGRESAGTDYDVTTPNLTELSTQKNVSKREISNFASIFPLY
ncbi:MAG: DUF3592 domain-containing protein [Thermoplasmata archaeon]